MRRLIAIVIASLSFPSASALETLAVESRDPQAIDQAVLADLGVRVDPEPLLVFIFPNEAVDEWRQRVRRLIVGLGADDYEIRLESFRALLQIGQTADEVIRELEPFADAETRSFVRALRQGFERKSSLRPYAIRELARALGQQARPHLIRLLSLPLEPGDFDAAIEALTMVGLPDLMGWTDMAPLSAQTQAALLRLWRLEGRPAEGFEAALASRDAQVRLEAACLLVDRASVAGLSALVDLLVTGSTSQRLVAEDWLFRRTTANLPCLPYEKDDVRATAMGAWRTWITAEGALVQPDAEPVPIPNGEALVCDFRGGRVIWLDATDTAAWQLTEVTGACHVQLLRSGRLLITAANEHRAFEYDRTVDPTTGKERGEVWSFSPRMDPGDMIGCAERLPNGNTMVLVAAWTSTKSRVIEVNGDGRVVREVSKDLGKVDDADVLADGRLLICDTGPRYDRRGQVRIIDWNGNVHWAVSCADPREADLLPNGNVLICDGDNGRVFEVEPSGAVVWSYPGLTGPHEADRLPNGNTTICDADGDRVFEVGPELNIVWELRATKVSHPDDLDRFFGTD